MEDPNEEEWMIEEFRPPEKIQSGIRHQIWKCGVDLGKKMAVTGILVSAAPLALPPLVVISALALAFSLPSGFYIASCAATHKIMAALLPNKQPHHLLMQHPHVQQERASDYKELEDGTSSGFRGEFDTQFVEEDDVGEYTREEGQLPSLVSEVHEGVLLQENGIDVDQLELELELDQEPSLGIPSQTNKGFPEAVEGPNRIEAALVSPHLVGENDADIEPVVVHGPKTTMDESMLKEHSTEKEEPIASISSEILKGIKEAEEEISLVENQSEEDVLGNGAQAVLISAEVGGENDTIVEQVDVIEDSRPSKVKFGDVDPEELERETTGMIESIRDQGISEPQNLLQEKEGSDDIELQGPHSETNSYEPEASLSTPIPNESNQDTDAILQSGSNPPLSAQKTQTLSHQNVGTRQVVDIADNLALQHTAEQEENSVVSSIIPDAIRVRKLVVRVSNSVDSKGTGISRGRGETLILRAGISTGISSSGIQHAYHGDATSKSIEGMNDEARIWKQMNALRTIVGYEAPPHSSCVDELKALYVFTGVEPPASFTELADVHEKLMFLMTVVGVKE